MYKSLNAEWRRVLIYTGVIKLSLCIGLMNPSSTSPLQAEEADDDDIYNVLATLKRLTAFHK